MTDELNLDAALRACADALAPSEEKVRALDIDQIILDVCELPGDTDPNDPDALTLTVAELRIVLEREAERLADALAPPEPGQCVYCRGPFGACECSPLPAPPRADALEAPRQQHTRHIRRRGVL